MDLSSSFYNIKTIFIGKNVCRKPARLTPCCGENPPCHNFICSGRRQEGRSKNLVEETQYPQKLIKQVAHRLPPRILQVCNAEAGSVKQEKVKMRKDNPQKGCQTTPKADGQVTHLVPTQDWRRQGVGVEKESGCFNLKFMEIKFTICSTV